MLLRKHTHPVGLAVILFIFLFGMVGCNQRRNSVGYDEPKPADKTTRNPIDKDVAENKQNTKTNNSPLKFEPATPSPNLSEPPPPVVEYKSLLSAPTVPPKLEKPPAEVKVTSRKDGQVIIDHFIAQKSSPEMRSWRSKKGGHETKAILQSVAEGRANLKKEDGKIVETPLAKLSDTDCDYIKELIRVDPDAKVHMGQVVDISRAHRLSVIDEEGVSRIIALDGIEIPSDAELAQHVTQYLTSTLLDRHCWIESRSTDNAVITGVVYRDGVNINTEILAMGLATYQPSSRLDSRFEQAESVAKALKLGLWRTTLPIE